MLQIGILISGGAALAVDPSSLVPVMICVVGSIAASLICERFASRYLQSTLGQLRRLADDIGHGRAVITHEPQRGEDFYKLIAAINLVAQRIEDLSGEEMRLQEKLRQTEKLAVLGELAANVAHEVNNPLDGIQNCSRILRRSLDDPERARQMLDLIDSGLVRIDLIVRRLLTLARQNVIRPQQLDVCKSIDAAIEAVAPTLSSREMSIRRDDGAGPAVASIDAPLLQQVFVNLLLNAADSMSDGGEIEIHTANQDTQIRISFADRGPGIDPEIMPHIFEPFYTTKQSGRGTGLGLAIAARIVDAHQGELSVHNREQGGAEFVVTIPRAAPRAGLPDGPGTDKTRDPASVLPATTDGV
jgi:signal transduction histidine kinase